MNNTDLETLVRRVAFIGDATAFPEYSQAVIYQEMYDKLQTIFEDVVVKARSGYWLKETIFNTTANVARYRVPPRSVVGGLEKVELALNSTSPYVAITEEPASIAQNYESVVGGMPWVFTMAGDQIELLPAPSTVLSLRLTYYIRPSRLVLPQTLGRISSFNATTRTVVVNTIPTNQFPTPGVALLSGVDAIDIVHPDGWHELAMVNVPQTFTGTTFTLGGSDSMSDVAVGDFVRVADQTDWPCLPDDFHRSLADTTAVKIMLELNMVEKASSVAASNGADILRFKSLLLPRVKSQPKQIPAMRRSRGWGFPSNGRW